MRQVKKLIIYACGEAATEKAFLRYIKNIYKNDIVHVEVDSANGSDPEVILDYAIRNATPIASKRFVLLDKDRPWKQELEDKAKKENFELIVSKPCCIEGMFLSLLDPKFKSEHTPLLKNKCKSKFRKYLSDKEKLDYRNYEKIFPKTKLEALRKKNKELDRIIHLMTDLPEETE